MYMERCHLCEYETELTERTTDEDRVKVCDLCNTETMLRYYYSTQLSVEGKAAFALMRHMSWLANNLRK
jgi:hypothetical protein